MWLNLSTGYWNFRRFESFSEKALAIRAFLPFAVLPFAIVILVKNSGHFRLPRLSPSRLLMFYGVVAAVASAFSNDVWASFYFGMAFLATVAAAWSWFVQPDSQAVSRRMLQITWVVTLAVTAIITYTARNVVFGGSTGYEVGTALGGVTRSSGLARWAAVPGIVCLIKLSHDRRPWRLALYVSLAIASFYIVYRMQSRGAVVGSIVALSFALLATSRLKRIFVPVIIFAAALLAATDSGPAFSEKVSTYMERGQSEQQFRSMTGRTRAFSHAVDAFWDAPLLGRGNWADRNFIGEHVHNSFLQALLNAGVIGFIPYVGSWLAGWVMFARLLRRRECLTDSHRNTLLEVGAVMMFFTARAIPETTTASFAVDLLVMTAAYVYLESLTLALEPRTSFGSSLRIRFPKGSARHRRNPPLSSCDQ